MTRYAMNGKETNMFYLPAIILLLKTSAPVWGKKAAEIAVLWGSRELSRAVRRKMEKGEARDPVEALLLVLKEWTQWLKRGSGQGPATEGV